jgi:hypothetical protein
VRVPVGNILRVGPGDKVLVQGRLPAPAQLGRLYVFASENDAMFSPYVPNVADTVVPNGRPVMLSPLSLRVHGAQPVRQLTFTSDIDGFICVMQEIDTPDEPLVKVRLSRTINPNLGWIAWAQRKLTSWQLPKHLS